MTNYDELLKIAGPVALTVREYLEPVHGADSVLFPATFAPPEGEDRKPAYVIDEIDGPDSDGEKKTKVGLIDSVGSQANRIEPIFRKPPYSALVPSGVIKIGERAVDILDMGHRAADALVRFSDQEARFRSAFEAVRDRGDCYELAKLAPTSIVFGAWDSRGTRVKLPRIVGSVIRAYGVQELRRSAQFFSAFEKSETEEMGLDQKTLSGEGLSDSPAGIGPGGVIARDGVIREATLNLIVIRSLSGGDEEKTGALQRYILGLSLIALLAPAELFLREGCLLTRSKHKKPEFAAVYRDGNRTDFPTAEEQALQWAQTAAANFGVGPGFAGSFQAERLKTVTEAKAKKPKKA
jgi:CRISPR-associated protein Csb1